MRIGNLLAVNRSWTLNDLGLLLFRVMVSASLFWHHGLEKLTGFSRMAQHFPDPLHIGVLPSLLYAAFADGICSLLVILGLATRLASFFSFINLAVVYFIVEHPWSPAAGPMPGGPGGTPGGMHGPPPGDHAELVFVYLAAYLLLTLVGAGRYSLDSRLR